MARGEDWTNEEEEQIVGEGWDESAKAAKDHSDSLYLKIEDGDSVQLNIISTPQTKMRAFEGQPAKPRVCVDVFCPTMPGPKKGEMGRLKRWEMAPSTFEDVRRIRNRRKDEFSDALIEVGRKGTGKNTKYWIDYVRQLNDGELAARDKANPFS